MDQDDLIYCTDLSIAVSHHHVHLDLPTYEALFGDDTEPTVRRYLSIPPCFAAEQTVTVYNMDFKNPVEMRIVGPLRCENQIEVLDSDGFEAPARLSGDLNGTPKCIIAGPEGYVITDGMCKAVKHIHISLDVSNYLKLYHGDVTSVFSETGYCFDDVIVRVNKCKKISICELHIDKDEGVLANLPIYSKGRLYQNSIDWMSNRMM